MVSTFQPSRKKQAFDAQQSGGVPAIQQPVQGPKTAAAGAAPGLAVNNGPPPTTGTPSRGIKDPTTGTYTPIGMPDPSKGFTPITGPINNGQASIDNLIEQFVRGQIANANNTGDQEKLIRQLEQQDLGKQQVAARASMGRAGFGSSGALSALQADQQRAAASQAAQDIFGVRKDAAQQALSAAGLDIQQRQAAQQEAESQARWAALQSLLGGQGSGPAPASGGGGGPDIGAGPGKSATGKDGLTDWLNGLGSFLSGHGWNEGPSAEGASTPTGSNDNGQVMQGSGGTYWKRINGVLTQTDKNGKPISGGG